MLWAYWARPSACHWHENGELGRGTTGNISCGVNRLKGNQETTLQCIDIGSYVAESAGAACRIYLRKPLSKAPEDSFQDEAAVGALPLTGALRRENHACNQVFPTAGGIVKCEEPQDSS